MMNPSAEAFYQDIKALITQSKGENPERLAKKSDGPLRSLRSSGGLTNG
jgi:hypothetical protein